MMNTTTEAGSGSGSIKKQTRTPALTDYFLPQQTLLAQAGLGFVTGSAVGFACPLVEGMSDRPLGARLRSRLHVGRTAGGTVAYCFPIIASLEHALGTWRGKRDLLNTFVAATAYGFLFPVSLGVGRGPFVAAARPLLMGCSWTLAEYWGQNAYPSWKYGLPAADD